MLSSVHGGSQTQLMVAEFTSGPSATCVSYSMRSVSGHVGEVSVMSTVALFSSSRWMP